MHYAKHHVWKQGFSIIDSYNCMYNNTAHNKIFIAKKRPLAIRFCIGPVEK